MHLLCIVVCVVTDTELNIVFRLGCFYSGALGPGYNRGDILF
jgi:hypothetical protein